MQRQGGSGGDALALKTQQLQEVVQELLATEAQMGEAQRQKQAVAAAAHAMLGIVVDSVNSSAKFLLSTASQVRDGQMQVQVSDQQHAISIVIRNCEDCDTAGPSQLGRVMRGECSPG